MYATISEIVSGLFLQFMFGYTLEANNLRFKFSPSAPTTLTTTAVEAEGLCNNTVARIPMIRLATGLLRILLDVNASPAVFPPSNRKTVLRRSKEQMKKNRNPRSAMITTKNKVTRLTFAKQSISVKVQNFKAT